MADGYAIKMFQNTWHPSWDQLMSADTIRVLEEIEHQIEWGYPCATYYPNKEKVLRFLNTDLSLVKYIVVGMEPYPSYDYIHNCPQATGRSFEVSELRGETWDYPIKQASLRNILKALYYNQTGQKASISQVRSAIHCGRFQIVNPDEWFDCMERQGVIFLNSTLTYGIGCQQQVHKMIWKQFRQILVPYLAQKDIVWMLWGKDAQNEISPYLPENKILTAPHPRLDAFVTQNTFQYAKDVDWTGISVR